MDDPITIRDLLSELTLRQKVWLLCKIYWRKVSGFFRLFGELMVEGFDYWLHARWIRETSPSKAMTEELGKTISLAPSAVISGLYGYENGVVKPMHEFDEPIQHYPNKNEPDEWDEWMNGIRKTTSPLITAYFTDDELRYFFSQDYSVSAMASMASERAITRKKIPPERNGATYYINFGTAASYQGIPNYPGLTGRELRKAQHDYLQDVWGLYNSGIWR